MNQQNHSNFVPMTPSQLLDQAYHSDDRNRCLMPLLPNNTTMRKEVVDRLANKSNYQHVQEGNSGYKVTHVVNLGLKKS